MKKITFLILTFIFSISTYCQAQDSNVFFGIKAGANYSKFSASLLGADYTYKPGFYLGGFTNFQVSEKFSLQADLLFSIQGSGFLIEDLSIREGADQVPKAGDFKVIISETTLSVPIVAKYFIIDRLYLEGGPQIGFILDRKDEVKKSPTNDPSFNRSPDIDPDMLDFGLTVGAGYKLSQHFTLNSRYFFGLIKRYNTVKSSVFNLGLAYTF